jgi:TolA-binding protein
MPKPKNGVALSPPIAENEYVQELLALMNANKIPGVKDMIAAIGQVTAMEQHLADMVKELATMRAELAEAQRQNHPIKNALQKAVITMQGNILDLRDKLNALKHDIVTGCKAALTATREKGLSALRGIANFFSVKPALENLRGDIEKAIREDDRAITRIEKVSAEYHKAGLAITNVARAVAGKDAKDEVKPMGNLAKAIAAPLRADRACARAMGRCVDKAIGAVARLEQTERKPPIMETIEKLDAEIKAAQRVTPVRVRAEPVHADR